MDLSEELKNAALDDFESFDFEEELYPSYPIKDTKDILKHRVFELYKALRLASSVQDSNTNLADAWLDLRNNSDNAKAVFKASVLGLRLKLYSHSWR